LKDLGRFVLAIVLSMANAGARAHHLYVAGLRAALIPEAVLMADGAFAHISDDLHIGVRMRRETGIRRDLVVVPYPDGAVAESLGVVIAGEGEMVLRLQPPMIRAAKLVERPAFNHLMPPNSGGGALALKPPYTFNVAPGLRAGKKRHGRCHLFRLAVAANRCARRHRRREIAVRRVHIRVDRSGLHIVDRDPLGPEIACPAARNRSDRNNASAFAHQRGGGAHGSGDAAHIDCELPVDLGQIVGAVVHLAGDEDAPALLTRISSLPNCSTTVLISASTSFALA
jgi:hypothetical protein